MNHNRSRLYFSLTTLALLATLLPNTLLAAETSPATSSTTSVNLQAPATDTDPQTSATSLAKEDIATTFSDNNPPMTLDYSQGDDDSIRLDAPHDTTSTDTAAPTKTTWDKIKGTKTKPALYLGMVTFHLEPGSRDDRWNNNLVAVSYDGFIAGTLMNSFDDRAFVFAIERLWSTQQLSANVTNSVGYRLGLITGYDERMMQIAEYTPVLPFPQVMDNIVIDNHFGLELSWCVDTVSAGLFYQF